MTNRILLKPLEAAEQLSISKTTLYDLIRTGELPAVRIAADYRIARESLETYVACQLPANRKKGG
jgi:excisionase family DNA binding protein